MSTREPAIVGVVGRSGAGKTTFLEQLVPALSKWGLRVAVIKHGHDFDLDRPGKDSWRLTQAGAASVIVSSARQMALIESLDAEWPVEQLVRLVADRTDLVLTEGYKDGPHPKIEVARQATGNPLCPAASLWAIVSDAPIPSFEEVPRFDLDGADQVASFLVDRLGLVATGVSGVEAASSQYVPTNGRRPHVAAKASGGSTVLENPIY